ncbi:hypothetical protein BV25DRAFT_1784358, partial [Artomyces pyxidatus]
KLPLEVLTRVFRFSALLEPPIPWATNLMSGLSLLGWMKVTNVCRLWRQAALGEPTLWADLNLELGRKWATELLARSKSVPLIV